MTTKERANLQLQVQSLVEKVQFDKRAASIASAAALGAAALAGTLFPEIGAAVGGVAVGVAAQYLGRLIEERRLLDDKAKELREETGPSHTEIVG